MSELPIINPRYVAEVNGIFTLAREAINFRSPHTARKLLNDMLYAVEFERDQEISRLCVLVDEAIKRVDEQVSKEHLEKYLGDVQKYHKIIRKRLSNSNWGGVVDELFEILSGESPDAIDDAQKVYHAEMNAIFGIGATKQTEEGEK